MDSYLSYTADDVEAIMSGDRDHEVLPYNATSSLSHMQPLLITGVILYIGTVSRVYIYVWT